MSPPPGNNGGAVSGAGPCPLAVDAQNKARSVSHRHLPHPITFRNLTKFSSSKRRQFQAHQSVSRETTGGQTRCEEVGEPMRRRLAGHGNAVRCCGQRKLSLGIRQMLASPRIRQGIRICHERMRAAQEQHASLAWSCNNPDHDDRATSNALPYSTASPVLASSLRRSRIHTPPERR
jgi:hypothetical protein